MTRAWLCGLLWLCRAAAALAQAPFVTDDAGVTERGRWHFELVDQWAELTPAERPATAQSTTVLNLGFGLAPGVELGCDVPWIAIAGAGAKASGWGDLDFYVKWHLTDGRGRRPAWAAVGAFESATGDSTKGLGSGVSDRALGLIAEWSGVAGFDLRSNLGVVFSGNSLTGEVGLRTRGRIWTANLSATRELEHWALGIELTGARGERDSAEAREARLQAGARWSLGAGRTLAASVQRGWFATPPWQLQLGVILDP